MIRNEIPEHVHIAERHFRIVGVCFIRVLCVFVCKLGVYLLIRLDDGRELLVRHLLDRLAVDLHGRLACLVLGAQSVVQLVDEHRFHLCVGVDYYRSALGEIEAARIAFAAFKITDTTRLVKDDIEPASCRDSRKDEGVFLTKAVRDRLTVDSTERGAVLCARLGILFDVLAQDLRDLCAFLVQTARLRRVSLALRGFFLFDVLLCVPLCLVREKLVYSVDIECLGHQPTLAVIVQIEVVSVAHDGDIRASVR